MDAVLHALSDQSRRTVLEVLRQGPATVNELAGELLASAVEDAETDGVGIREAVANRAHGFGRELGRAAGSADPMPVLQVHGFEPRLEEGGVRLGNCPFHNLAQQHTSLVCGMNLHLIEGLLEGLPRSSGYAAVLAPRPDNCCVVLEVPSSR